MGEVVYIAAVVSGVLALTLAPLFIILGLRRKNINKVDESWINDQQILQYFNEEPDRMLSATALAEKTGISKSALAAKLSQLQMNGVLMAYSTGIRSHYHLRKPLPHFKIDLPMSKITIDDLINIFIQCDFNVNLADIVSTTGLSVKDALKEMKILKIEGIANRITNPYGDSRYVLAEPYKSEAAKIKSQDLLQASNVTDKSEPALDLKLLEIALKNAGHISEEMLLESGYSSSQTESIINQLETDRIFQKVVINQEEVFVLRK